MSERAIPDYPENVSAGITALQEFVKAEEKARLYSKNGQYSDHDEIMRNLQLQVAKLGVEAHRAQVLSRRRAIDPASNYASELAETLYTLISLTNTNYGSLDLAEALRLQAKKHVVDEKESKKKSEKAEKKRRDAMPKYHKEGSGLNPYRKDGLYGKAAEAADGDWYSSH